MGARSVMVRRRHWLAALTALLVAAVSCGHVGSLSDDEVRREVESAVAEILNHLQPPDPTVNVWGEACPPIDQRLGPCDELSASIQWEPPADETDNLCTQVDAVSAQLSALEAYRIRSKENCLLEFCYRELPGAISTYQPTPTLQIMIGSDKSRCH